MSAFWIFAACVTAAYIVYYTVIICIDLYSKPKDQAQDNAETFEIDTTPSEESKAVEETDGGFRVASNGSDGWEETNIQPATQKDKPEESSDDVKLDATGAPMTPAQQKIEDASNDMEEIEPEMSGERTNLAYQEFLRSGEASIKITKTTEQQDTTNNKQDNNGEKSDQNDSQIRDRI